jgi:hypothetical protein
MEFKKMIRMQMVVAGLGMALLCAGATKAQEIVNTQFNDGPNVAAFDQPAAVQAPTTQAPNPQTAVEAVPPIPDGVSTGDDDPYAKRMLWTGTFLIWVGAIGIYFCGPAKRFAQQLRSLRKMDNVSEA